MKFIQPFRQFVVAIIEALRVVVGDVIAPPHKGVHRAQRIALAPRKNGKSVVEILGGGAGNTPADRIRHIQLRSRGRKLRRHVSHGGAHRIFPSAARATSANLRVLEIVGRRPSTR